MTKFLTAKELSQLLRIPKRSIYKFAKEGQIPGALRIGKHWRFCEDIIEAWVKGLSERSRKSKTSDEMKVS